MTYLKTQSLRDEKMSCFLDNFGRVDGDLRNFLLLLGKKVIIYSFESNNCSFPNYRQKKKQFSDLTITDAFPKEKEKSKELCSHVKNSVCFFICLLFCQLHLLFFVFILLVSAASFFVVKKTQFFLLGRNNPIDLIFFFACEKKCCDRLI